mmetsp:Transcript_7750/g.13756  ORF Transcript_7750/g.13756 Transcript_7750/m.13756 type:complete len:211 (+) Transcript_7750:51-683(+)|eukprot:CAMPEP_0197662796 /NCGR_PEP_ID=MMETSP1338-20131121/54775_1 /TAXON_ID=43686 ORGANISM="Pelagodinium beii, Strain RCC1491" /NCGR_SAMPLE_ID=MMETSP1338 /ASSEMBLY_ACC=CAM_ASM_000754 /LENGTH=210 /DNA_ID=CAMNT_0043240801 /DNA_START=51 /DNA_END=683 /DNA_ORIENTATION=+
MTKTNCALRILDTKLAKEYQDTCQEYSGYVRQPGQSVPLKQLWKCQQSNWSDTFREWGVIQLYVGVLVAIINAIIGFIGQPGNVVSITIELIVQLVASYLFAHLTWFGVVKKNGCFCCIIGCCEGHPILLLYGALAILWGVLGFWASFTGIGDCVVCIVRPILQAIHAITLVYMGIAAVKIWSQLGSEIIPGSLGVTGPNQEVVGAAQVV